MTTFAIYFFGSGDDPRVARVRDYDRFADGLPDDVACYRVVEPDDLDAIPGRALVGLYNQSAETPVKRFADKAAAIRRTFPTLPSLAKEADGDDAAPRKQQQRVNDAQKIVLLVSENPKRVGSAAHARFTNYRDGMTVAAALEAGITRQDLSYDVKHGFIELS